MYLIHGSPRHILLLYCCCAENNWITHRMTTATRIKLRVGQKSSITSNHHIDATVQEKNEMDCTKMFLEFLRIKIGYSFYAVVKYSFQIRSVLLYQNGSSMEYFGEMSLILIWNVRIDMLVSVLDTDGWATTKLSDRKKQA